jgi:hypothetical protein
MIFYAAVGCHHAHTKNFFSGTICWLLRAGGEEWYYYHQNQTCKKANTIHDDLIIDFYHDAVYWQ